MSNYFHPEKKVLDMHHVKQILASEADADTRMKAAKIILFDIDHNPVWLVNMAQPYSITAADAPPARVALVLLACGYKPREAARRSVPQVTSVSKSGSVRSER